MQDEGHVGKILTEIGDRGLERRGGGKRNELRDVEVVGRGTSCGMLRWRKER